MSRLSENLSRFCVGATLILLTALYSGCPGSSPPLDLIDLGTDIGADVEIPGDLPMDTPGETGPQPCMGNEDCPEGMVCHPEFNVCVQCLTEEDCPVGFQCVEWACREMIPCADMTCPDPLVCDPETVTCVDCLVDDDCPEGFECKDKTCVEIPKSCNEGGECPPGTVCDVDSNTCLECLSDGDCADDSYCDIATHTCQKKLCEPEYKDCVGNAVVVCRDNGGGWDLLQTCPTGWACVDGECVEDCTSDCDGKECGPNGCGGSCGQCADDEVCSIWGQCTCIPNCLDKQCGNDGCGGSCGSCPLGYVCSNGACEKICTPQCFGKQCGDDGCGGSCGSCPAGSECNGGICTDVCVPQCAGKQCGDDGCGGDCGPCKPGFICKAGKCYEYCAPQCKGKECGGDGCGGECGTCNIGWYCAMGECQQECLPNCIAKHCGPDGCGGSCGGCPDGYICSAGGQCLPSCLPQCEDKECGSDKCGGQCGYCDGDQNCIDGLCEDFVSCYDILTCNWSCPPDDEDACSAACFAQGSPAAQKQWTDLWYCLWDLCGGKPQGAPCWNNALQGPCKNLYYECMNCTPNCEGKQCGPDGCGGLCGECADGALCDDFGQCPCQPKCTGKECGPDTCGGLCGTCKDPLICNNQGQCACLPLCEGKECGTDGCGGSCGMCPDNWECIAGKCKSPCKPECLGKECGPDGCGGICGKCGPEEICYEEIGYCAKQSDGCEPSEIPGCGGCLCEDCVCGMDPFCCEVAWDGICVDLCYQCGGCGCVPNCVGPDGQQKECGDDGCGGQCGFCPPGLSCKSGMCIPQPMMTCEEGIDCAISCGGDIKYCLEMCIQNVYPDQQEYAWMLGECVLGYCMDNAGGYIDPDCYFWAIEGPCAEQYQMCVGGTQPCGPAGPQSCLGNCGGPAPGGCYCDDACQDYGDCCSDYSGCCGGPCIPDCQGKECGSDGCGGSCGTCPQGLPCNDNGQCEDPNQKSCGDAVQCALSCGGLDPGCLTGCLSGASGQSQQLMFDLIICLVQVCGFNLDPTCIAGAISGECSQQFAACMAD